MTRIIKPVILLLIAAGCYCVHSREGNDQFYMEMKEDFVNPFAKVRPKVYWWWLNGNLVTVRIKEELFTMKNACITGFDIFEIGIPKSDISTKAGSAFLRDESLKAIKTSLTETGRTFYSKEIANTWSNRLTGDAITGRKNTNTSTNIKSANISGLNKIQVPCTEITLIESGLLDPVRLYSMKPVKYLQK